MGIASRDSLRELARHHATVLEIHFVNSAESKCQTPVAGTVPSGFGCFAQLGSDTDFPHGPNNGYLS